MLNKLLGGITDVYRDDWDERARDNHRAYTASLDWKSEQEYTESGIRDGKLLFEF